MLRPDGSSSTSQFGLRCPQTQQPLPQYGLRRVGTGPAAAEAGSVAREGLRAPTPGRSYPSNPRLLVPRAGPEAFAPIKYGEFGS